MSEYTKPELRDRLKEEIQAGDKGGEPGQWSARKAQLLAQRYEAEGGGYRGRKSAKQKHLDQWSDQDWQTKEGGAGARGEDGTSRYLPEVAWKLLTKSEREATDSRKRGGEEQFVANTDAAKEARKAAELLSLTAAEAVKAVRDMDTKSQLRRARQAEKDHGKARKTVLAAIEKRLNA